MDLSPPIHTVPINDLHPHVTDGSGCLCNPSTVYDIGGGSQIIHNSWDGREYYEEDGPGYV